MQTLKNIQKSHKAEGESKSHSAKKVKSFCLRMLVKKLAHMHRLEHEPSGSKSKHLTTRPRTPELCNLPAETRELSRGKKHPHFPITLAYRKCKNKPLKISQY